jgi:hypothetical protein
LPTALVGAFYYRWASQPDDAYLALPSDICALVDPVTRRELGGSSYQQAYDTSADNPPSCRWESPRRQATLKVRLFRSTVVFQDSYLLTTGAEKAACWYGADDDKRPLRGIGRYAPQAGWWVTEAGASLHARLRDGNVLIDIQIYDASPPAATSPALALLASQVLDRIDRTLTPQPAGYVPQQNPPCPDTE